LSFTYRDIAPEVFAENRCIPLSLGYRSVGVVGYLFKVLVTLAVKVGSEVGNLALKNNSLSTKLVRFTRVEQFEVCQNGNSDCRDTNQEAVPPRMRPKKVFDG
jgi:hypothetical protein